MDLYTQSFTIPSGGWTGGASALISSATAQQTINVRLWRDDTPSGQTLSIALRPGEVFPIKVRWVNHTSGVVGLN